jgi:hypothetical protein
MKAEEKRLKAEQGESKAQTQLSFLSDDPTESDDD